MNKTLLYTGLAAIALLSAAGCKDENTRTSTPNGIPTPSAVQEAQPIHEQVVMNVNAPLCNNKPTVKMGIDYLIGSGHNEIFYDYGLNCGGYTFYFERHPERKEVSCELKLEQGETKYHHDGRDLYYMNNNSQLWRDEGCDGNDISWKQAVLDEQIGENLIQAYENAQINAGVEEVGKAWLELQKERRMLRMTNTPRAMAFAAPACNNNPTVAMADNHFSIECGDIAFFHNYEFDYVYDDTLKIKGNPFRLWRDVDGNGSPDEYQAVSDPATDTIVQEFQDVLAGIGQPEVQAKFEEWLKANGQ